MATSGPGSTTIVVRNDSGPGCLVQGLWYLLVGWWLGAAAIAVAWILNLTIVGLPVGMAILNNIPRILALQSPARHVPAASHLGSVTVASAGAAQHSFWLRAAYFVLVGWWWSGVWLALAYSACGTLILLPLGLHMFRLAPAMTTLRRF